MIPVVVVRRRKVEPEIVSDIPRSQGLRFSDVSRFSQAPDKMRQTESASRYSIFGNRAPRFISYDSSYPWYYSQAWHPFLRRRDHEDEFGAKVPYRNRAAYPIRRFTATYDQRTIERGNPVPFGSTVPTIGRRR